jgi:hypothetical protein
MPKDNNNKFYNRNMNKNNAHYKNNRRKRNVNCSIQRKNQQQLTRTVINHNKQENKQQQLTRTVINHNKQENKQQQLARTVINHNKQENKQLPQIVKRSDAYFGKKQIANKPPLFNTPMARLSGFQCLNSYNQSPLMSLLAEPLISNQELEQVPEVKEPEEDTSNYEYVKLTNRIESLTDLIELGNLYISEYKDKKIRFNIDIKTLSNMLEPLNELNNLIGLDKFKLQIVDQIIYFLQKLDNQNNDMLHTVLYGTPGVGKTQIAGILGKLYSKMGLLSKGTFRSVKRPDLVGRYLGETAIKTTAVLNAALGGVLLLDEAYSLGNPEQKDNFSRECIDMICSFLTEHKNDFMMIIAGYKSSLDTSFFSYNSGLQSRFPHRYKIDTYSPQELRLIFIKMITDHGWSIASDKDIPLPFFEANKEYFIYNGRDMESLFARTKIAHARRVIYLEQSDKTIITNVDLNNGFNIYLKNDEVKTRKTNGKETNFMYL